MNFLYKRKGSERKDDDIELKEFTRKKILTSEASSSVVQSLKRKVHFPMILMSNPSLEDVAKVCINVGIPTRLVKLTGGMSNLVWKVDLSGNQSVILRIFGSNSDELINRDTEMQHFVKLSELNIGPKCLATFSNGRIEEFLHASQLTSSTLQHESVAIAQMMAKFHAIPAAQSEIMLWKYLDKWYQAVLKILLNNSTLHNQFKKTVDIYSLGNDIKRLKSLIDFKNSIVFSHNDLQYGNIMKLNDSNLIQFIDYEYTGPNYLEFDIANHFCEYMADYNSSTPHILDKSKYPSQEQQESFIMNYLKAKYPEKLHDTLLNESNVVMKRMPLFTLCSHLVWGLWGIIYGSKTSEDGEFDYISYAMNRLKMYEEIRITTLDHLNTRI
jgi:thiamine kinase-like enzyme